VCVCVCVCSSSSKYAIKGNRTELFLIYVEHFFLRQSEFIMLLKSIQRVYVEHLKKSPEKAQIQHLKRSYRKCQSTKSQNIMSKNVMKEK